MMLCIKCYRKTQIAYNELCYLCYKKLGRVALDRNARKARIIEHADIPLVLSRPAARIISATH